jgi:anti-sigma B factor antagonist
VEVTTPHFRLETEERPRGVIVRLFGDFDHLAFGEVDAVLRSVQRDADADVVLDLRALDFMDSNGIRALINARARAEAVRGRFRVIRGPKHIQRVLELVGLDDRLDFVDLDDGP